MYDSRDFSTLPLHGTRGKHSSYLAKLRRASWLLIRCTQTRLAVWKTQKPRRRKTSWIYWLDYLIARTTAMYLIPSACTPPALSAVLSWWLWAVSLSSTSSSDGRTPKRLQELTNPQDIDKTSISSSHSNPTVKTICNIYAIHCQYWMVFYGKGRMALTNLQARVNIVYCSHFHLDLQSTDLHLSKQSERSQELHETWTANVFSPDRL